MLPMHDITVGRVLGEGGNAVVYQGVLEGTTLVAMKVLKLKLTNASSQTRGPGQLNYNSDHSALVVARMQQETKILSALSHPNVVTHYRSGILSLPSLTSHKTSGDAEPAGPHDLYYALVLDYCDGGDLATFLDLQQRPPGRQAEIPINERLRLATQAAAGFAHIHSVGLMHRDVKWYVHQQ